MGTEMNETWPVPKGCICLAKEAVMDLRDPGNGRKRHSGVRTESGMSRPTAPGQNFGILLGEGWLMNPTPAVWLLLENPT